MKIQAATRIGIFHLYQMYLMQGIHDVYGDDDDELPFPSKSVYNFGL